MTARLIDQDQARTIANSEKDRINLARLSQEHAERTFYSVDQTPLLQQLGKLPLNDFINLSDRAYFKFSLALDSDALYFSQDVFVNHERMKSQLMWQGAIASFLLLAFALVSSWYVVTGRRHSVAQRRALRQLQTIASSAPGVLFQYVQRPDGTSCFAFVSEGVRDLFLCSSEEVIGNSAKVCALIHPEDACLVNESVRVSARTLRPLELDFRVKFKDGAIRWMFGKAIPLKLVDGSVQWNGFISDATAHNLEQESLITLSTAVEQSPVSVVITDTRGLIQYVNPMFEQVTGYTRVEAIGKNPRILSSGEKSENDYSEMWATLLAGKIWAGEFHNRRKDGSLFWEKSTIAPILDSHGETIHYLAVKENITDRKLADVQLRIAATVFESEEGMFITDNKGVILRVNQAFSRITGYEAREAIGQTPSLLSSGRHKTDFYACMWQSIIQGGSWQGEIWNQRKSGEIYPEWLTISAVRDDQQTLTHYVATLADITKRKASEAEIEHLAFYDSLTGLPNRRLLIDRLKQTLASSSRHHRNGALLFIDLDNFKNLNDTQGHDQGDLLLQQVAKRLNVCVRDGDTVARLGGDEFVVMLQDLSVSLAGAATQAEVVGTKILEALRMPYNLSQITHYSSASLGVTLFNEYHKSVDELLKRADLALYKAKGAGRNTLRFFDPEMQTALTTRSALETELRQGLQENQFLLYYQPQVDKQGQLAGVEALVHWQHPRRGIVSSSEFIALAEDTRLILPLSQWVLETACRQLKIWATRSETSHLTMAVNVSVVQFHREDFVQQVLETISRTGAPPFRLRLELTESLLVKDIEGIIAKMLALKVQGIGFSMEDFGARHSSLAYLKRLPLDQLKIDPSFLNEAVTNHKDAAIIRAIVSLGKNLGLMVIAEGVQTEAQHNFLETEGCYNFQGHYFGPPAPVEALGKFFSPA